MHSRCSAAVPSASKPLNNHPARRRQSPFSRKSGRLLNVPGSRCRAGGGAGGTNRAQRARSGAVAIQRPRRRPLHRSATRHARRHHTAAGHSSHSPNVKTTKLPARHAGGRRVVVSPAQTLGWLGASGGSGGTERWRRRQQQRRLQGFHAEKPRQCLGLLDSQPRRAGAQPSRRARVRGHSSRLCWRWSRRRPRCFTEDTKDEGVP